MCDCVDKAPDYVENFVFFQAGVAYKFKRIPNDS